MIQNSTKDYRFHDYWSVIINFSFTDGWSRRLNKGRIFIINQIIKQARKISLLLLVRVLKTLKTHLSLLIPRTHTEMQTQVDSRLVASPLDSVTWTLALGCTPGSTALQNPEIGERHAGRTTSRCRARARTSRRVNRAGWMSGEYRAPRISPRPSTTRRNDTDTKRYREPESHTRRAINWFPEFDVSSRASESL